jgi:hypothetical protein
LLPGVHPSTHMATHPAWMSKGHGAGDHRERNRESGECLVHDRFLFMSVVMWCRLANAESVRTAIEIINA